MVGIRSFPFGASLAYFQGRLLLVLGSLGLISLGKRGIGLSTLRFTSLMAGGWVLLPEGGTLGSEDQGMCSAISIYF